MDNTRKLWIGLGTLLAVSFAILLFMGGEIHRQAPPMPERVVATDGTLLFERADIERGRQVWQSFGGMQLGSIWGHGGYVAPDWSADWVHREALALLDLRSRRRESAAFNELDGVQQAALIGELRQTIRRNTYDPATATITLDEDRIAAVSNVAAHYESLFGNDPATASLREAYAMKNDTVADPDRRRSLAAFFWWTAWAAMTERPGRDVTYTNNWPGEPLIGNAPTATMYLWSAFSVLFLIAGIALLGWHHAVTHGRESGDLRLPDSDPLALVRVTPSMRATAGYFWIVLALFLVQILLGAMTAHYQVEGQQLYGMQLSDILPYSLTRTWHTQLAVLWIATAWLGTGLYIGPAISGHEPRFQRAGVLFLLASLVIITVGSFAGQWLAVMQKLGLELNFWFGHQGWEYADIGRFWQWYLFVGLMLWLLLVGRALWPALRRKDESRSIVGLLFLSVVCIGLFFGAASCGTSTRTSRWSSTGAGGWSTSGSRASSRSSPPPSSRSCSRGSACLQARTATIAVLFATIVFMAGGVLGTLHHLYFAGTPTAVLALGASFSALEVVPLAYIGFEAYHTWKLGRATPWMARYKLADHVLHRRRVLEPGGRRALRLPDQSAAVAVLHAGPQPDAAARPYGPVRRVRHARHRPGAVLPARHEARPRLERRPAQDHFLVPQYRPCADGAAHAAAAGHAAAPGRDRTRLLVCALGRVHAAADRRPAGVAARAGRHDLQRRRARVDVVRVAAVGGTQAGFRNACGHRTGRT